MLFDEMHGDIPVLMPPTNPTGMRVSMAGIRSRDRCGLVGSEGCDERADLIRIHGNTDKECVDADTQGGRPSAGRSVPGGRGRVNARTDSSEEGEACRLVRVCRGRFFPRREVRSGRNRRDHHFDRQQASTLISLRPIRRPALGRYDPRASMTCLRIEALCGRGRKLVAPPRHDTRQSIRSWS